MGTAGSSHSPSFIVTFQIPWGGQSENSLTVELGYNEAL